MENWIWNEELKAKTNSAPVCIEVFHITQWLCRVLFDQHDSYCASFQNMLAKRWEWVVLQKSFVYCFLRIQFHLNMNVPDSDSIDSALNHFNENPRYPFLARWPINEQHCARGSQSASSGHRQTSNITRIVRDVDNQILSIDYNCTPTTRFYPRITPTEPTAASLSAKHYCAWLRISTSIYFIKIT